jgi:arginine:agmatine antiporter
MRKVGVIPATLMVAGNIMGSGVFMLPASLAGTGGIAIFGWAVTIIGAMSLSLVYAKFASFEDGEGGSYYYVKKAFGEYMGFQTNAVYWLAGWIGNIAMAVVGVGYLAFFFPFLKDPLMAAIATIGVIWLFTFVNILGPNVVTKIQSWTTSLVFIPIFGVAIFGWFWFDASTYTAAWNVSGKDAFGAIQGTLNVTLWAFIGVETAAVVAGVVDNPKKNVPIATMGGVTIAAVAYVLSSTAIMGIIPNATLAESSAPFADAVALAVGPMGGAIVSFCAAAGCLGSLGGWTMVVGQSAKAAADDGLFPAIFARVNKAGTPAIGLVIVAILMSSIVLFTISPTAAAQFGMIASISVIMTLLPYIYTCAALRELGPPHFGKLAWLWRSVILVAIVYAAWAVIGSDATQVLWTFVFVLLTTLFFARSHGRMTAVNEARLATPVVADVATSSA